MKTLIIFLSIATLFFSCKKEQGEPNVINGSLYFLPKKNNIRLPDSILNFLKLSYNANGSKVFIQDFQRAIPTSGPDLGIMQTRDIGDISGKQGIKNFYLEYPNGSRDTLFIDYKYLSYKEAIKHPCYCYVPLEAVRYNGAAAPIDTSIKVARVYLFLK